MAKRKRRRRGRRSPDEMMNLGHLQAARFGNTVVMRNLQSSKEHARMMAAFAAEYPAICARLDATVVELRSLVALHTPLSILHRAAWMNTHAQATAPKGDESEIVRTRQVLEYAQSAIASTPPAAIQTDLGEAEWKRLCDLVASLYDTLAREYFIARTACAQRDDANLDEKVAQFCTGLQIQWLVLRGERYLPQEVPRLQLLLAPHDAVLRELFGADSAALCAGFDKLRHVLIFGIPDLAADMRKLHEDWEAWARENVTSNEDGDITEGHMRPQDEEWARRVEDIRQRYGPELYDVARAAGLPRPLLEALAFGPGEDTQFFAEGPLQGWPLRELPQWKRPFLRVDGRFYCFDVHGLFDHLYRLLQRFVLRARPSYGEEWKRSQTEASEAKAAELLQALLPTATVYRNVKYQAASKSGKREWCECDVVACADEVVIAAEVKSGAWTPTSPATDFPAFQRSAKQLFEAPARQADRLLRTLEEGLSVELFDAGHQSIGTLRLSDFETRQAMCLTLDSMTTLAAQAEYLGPLGTDLSTRPTWVLSLSDLETYRDILKVPGQFVHFMGQRVAAIGTEHARTTDEGDHLGLYLEHLLYTWHTEQYEGITRIGWDYTGKVDAYYGAVLYDPATAIPPNHSYSPATLNLLRAIQASQKRGHLRALCYLLDVVPPSLNQLIDQAPAYLSGQRSHAKTAYFSVGGEHAVILAVTQEGVVARKPVAAKDHALASMLINEDEPCLSIEAHYRQDGTLASADFAFLRKSDIPAGRHDELRKIANPLQLERHRRRPPGKVGRNERCPCGSGKKYKKCCWLKGL